MPETREVVSEVGIWIPHWFILQCIERDKMSYQDFCDAYCCDMDEVRDIVVRASFGDGEREETPNPKG